MNSVARTIDPRRLEFAVGATGVVFYLRCVLTMTTVSHDGAVASLNALAHQVERERLRADRTPVTRSEQQPCGWVSG
jgi:hypothetical protein